MPLQLVTWQSRLWCHRKDALTVSYLPPPIFDVTTKMPLQLVTWQPPSLMSPQRCPYSYLPDSPRLWCHRKDALKVSYLTAPVFDVTAKMPLKLLTWQSRLWCHGKDVLTVSYLKAPVFDVTVKDALTVSYLTVPSLMSPQRCPYS